MITIKAHELTPGMVVCKAGNGRRLKIVSVQKSASISVRYDDGKIEFFNPEKSLKVTK